MAVPKEPYDPSRILTYCALLFVAGSILALSAIIGWQIYTDGEASTEWVGQLCLVIGWVLGKAGDIYNHTFGTTSQSQAKDATIATQARTAAVLQGAAIPAPAPSDPPTKETP